MAQKPVNTAMLGDNFQFSLGPPDSGFSIFLADRTKKIHFIRHAEGHHNVMTATSGNNDCLTVDHAGECPADHALWDARLTEVGVAQAKSLRDHLATRPSGGRSFTSFDLVVVSPLTRTCETALHVFGRGRKPGCPAFLDAGLTPPMSPEARQGLVTAAPRILVREECRERWGKFVCDGRRPISAIIKEFPDFDFSEVGRRPDQPGACAHRSTGTPCALQPPLHGPAPPDWCSSAWYSTCLTGSPADNGAPPHRSSTNPNPNPTLTRSSTTRTSTTRATSARATSTAASVPSPSCR